VIERLNPQGALTQIGDTTGMSAEQARQSPGVIGLDVLRTLGPKGKNRPEINCVS
jgi:hypothetical protein